jgi:molybdopterin converting factor subunit 1
VRLLYFAALRDATGLAEEERSLPPDVTTIAALGAWLEREVPALSGRLGSVRFAIDEAFVGPEARVEAGHVIALIPPVSGG